MTYNIVEEKVEQFKQRFPNLPFQPQVVAFFISSINELLHQKESATPEQILAWLNNNGHQDIALILLTKLRKNQSELDQPTV